ncbi:MAG: hypothetical protein LBP22_14175 [Deltaproteobacteria bacterium]|jgi:hypothetical protein|nr:hypothetical protein [Deltaproteobacteria bacterium]
MRSTLDELITELEDLDTLAKSIAPVNRALADHKDTVVQRYILVRKRFDYAAFAVALYASFEKFIENLIKEYVRLETRRIDYAELPQKLTDKHLIRSAELICRRRLGKGRYIGLSELGVVKNLFDCLSGTKPYVINQAAVIAHDVNLRASEVDAVFSVIGIDNICDRVCRTEATMTWYCDTHDLETPLQDGVKRTVIEERLKDIVERRNQVSHRGDIPIDLPGDKEMSEAVAFIKSLATSIFGLVAGRYLQAHHAASMSRIELTLRADPDKNWTIVVVGKPGQRLFVGQPVFVIVESKGVRWGRIQSLRVDDADIQEIEVNTNAPAGVGVGLDFEYPKSANMKLIALQADDDVVWSPLKPMAAPATSAN